MSLVLGIDIGTSSAKAVLCSEDGRLLGQGEAPYQVSRPRPGWAEQSPADWCSGAATAARAACGEFTGNRRQIIAIGLCGQMHGTVLLGAAEELLSPAVIWPDGRTSAQVREIEGIVGRKRLLSTAGSVAATGSQAATVRWFQQHEPDVWARTRRVLLPKDYVRMQMVGDVHTDPSDASGTLFLDLRTRAWSKPLLRSLEVDQALLPPIADSTARVGTLSPDLAGDLGLDKQAVVVAGASDTAAGALGAGVTYSGALLLTLSTGGQLVQPSGDPSVDRQGRAHTFCAAAAEGSGLPKWYHLGAILSAGGALAWVRNLLAQDRKQSFVELTASAAKSPVGSRGLLFLPYLLGERTPHMDPTASGMLVGLASWHLQADLVRAVMEGVALACFDAYQVLAGMGEEPDHLVVAGGGARSELWRQIIADVFGLPVRHLVGGTHSAMGAAMLAAAGAGLITVVEPGGDWVRHGAEALPRAWAHELYQETYQMFQSTYQKHQDDFQVLRRLANRESECEGAV